MAKTETRVVDENSSIQGGADSSKIFDELAVGRPHAAAFVPSFMEVLGLGIDLFEDKVCILFVARCKNMKVVYLADSFQ